MLEIGHRKAQAYKFQIHSGGMGTDTKAKQAQFMSGFKSTPGGWELIKDGKV